MTSTIALYIPACSADDASCEFSKSNVIALIVSFSILIFISLVLAKVILNQRDKNSKKEGK